MAFQINGNTVINDDGKFIHGSQLTSYYYNRGTTNSTATTSYPSFSSSTSTWNHYFYNCDAIRFYIGGSGEFQLHGLSFCGWSNTPTNPICSYLVTEGTDLNGAVIVEGAVIPESNVGTNVFNMVEFTEPAYLQKQRDYSVAIALESANDRTTYRMGSYDNIIAGTPGTMYISTVNGFRTIYPDIGTSGAANEDDSSWRATNGTTFNGGQIPILWIKD